MSCFSGFFFFWVSVLCFEFPVLLSLGFGFVFRVSGSSFFGSGSAFGWMVRWVDSISL